MKKLLITFITLLFIFSCSKRTTSSTSATAATKAPEAAVKVAKPQPEIKDVAVATPTIETPKEVVKEVTKESANIVLGKETYKVKCSKCHGLKEPQEYNALKWGKIIDWMGPRAKIDAEEKENILAYVSFYAKK
jgi:mono/diheme cytochrome c family protein